MQKPLAVCALALLLPASTLFAAEKKPGVSISFNSDDSHTRFGARHIAADGRPAITTRDGSTMLLLLDDAVAVQLTDRALTNMESIKHDAGFLEELLVSGVKLTLGKAVEYPIANIKSVDVVNGALRIITDENKPLFSELKVNGSDVLRDFSATDAARFVNAFRAPRR
jgi:hypothetical protein